jgi:predicted metalloprotease
MARTDRQRRSTNIEDRRGRGPAMGGAAASAGGALLLKLLFSRGGRRILLPLVVILVLAFVLFPSQTQRFLASILGGGAPVTRLDPETSERLADNTAAVLGSTEDVWTAVLAEEGDRYPFPTLVLFAGSVQSACGYATAAAGPFYCPADSKLYLDLSFFEELDRRLGAGGDFAQAYVIAHEVGHHVENITGVLDNAQLAQQRARSDVEANRVQVRVELMADCLAGVWAGEAERKSQILLEPGDVEEAIGAAEAVGDDTLQRRSQGMVVPDAFTHGSADQRVYWFQRGFTTRDVDACAEVQTLPYEHL